MVIPVHDVNPVRRTPWVTYLLIGLNLIVFLLTPAASTAGVVEPTVAQVCEQEAFYHHYAAIPEELIHNQPLPVAPTGEVGTGQAGVGCIVEPRTYDKVPALSVLFSMFLHGGWLHLLGNMLFLWVFGNNVEDRLGKIGFTLFYVFCGYAAAYGFSLFNSDSVAPVIGASGAVAGVLGAYLALWPRVRVWSLVPVLFFLPLRLPVWLVLGMWFAIQWVYSVGIAVTEAGSVAYLAHVIGFLAGLLVALPLRRPAQPRYPTPTPRL